MNQETQNIMSDLSTCAEQQIHIPGSVQPHGVLLAVDQSDLRIVQVSANVNELLGIPHSQLLGQSLEILLGELQLRSFSDALSGKEVHSPIPMPLRVLSRPREREFDAVVHRVDQLVIIELELAESEIGVNAPEFFRNSYTAISDSLQCESRSELLTKLASLTRNATGFERVMVYLFEPNWDGIVVAESRDQHVDSYIGRHFPASDIPAQARALYAKNRLRLLVDANAKPSPILTIDTGETVKPLNLSQSILRSMAPIHVEYLNNMQVTASMSISLVDKSGELRGLIACHHSVPMRVSYQLRVFCDFLAQLGSLRLANFEFQENSERQMELLANRDKLLRHLQTEKDIPQGLISSGDLLLDVCGADGAAVVTADRFLTTGATPERKDLIAIVDFLKENAAAAVFSTDCISEHLASAATYKTVSSGLLAIKKSLSEDKWLLWFRAERLTEVSWAGQPEKVVEADGLRIHPRKSFEDWKQQVVGKSLPWSDAEIESVINLRIRILEKSLYIAETEKKELLQKQMEELSKLNAALVAQAAELRVAQSDALQASQRKSEMVALVSHDLRSPLTSIRGSLSLVANGIVEAGVEAREICQSAFESSTYLVNLIGDLLDVESLESGDLKISRKETALDPLFRHACELVKTLADAADVDLKVVPTDLSLNIDSDRILQVLVNLVANAIKFSAAGKSIELSAKSLEGAVVIAVKDQGRGVPEEFRTTIFGRFVQVNSSDRSEKGGTGLGLAICRALIEAHDGSIGVDSVEGEGSTFWCKFPILRDV
ncbi:ATP-binding protein [soil metagenome]